MVRETGQPQLLAPSRSADFQSAVSPIYNRQAVRIFSDTVKLGAVEQNAILDTAD